MNGNRYSNTRRAPWPQREDDQRWQVRYNVCSFGYRRHELNENTSPSTSSGQDAAASTTRFIEDDSNFDLSWQQRDKFSSGDSYGTNYGACEQTYAASGSVGENDVQRAQEVCDLTKAVFDADFRLSSSPRRNAKKPRVDFNLNPYRAVPTTAAQQKWPLPTLKNRISNPWKAEECDSRHIARRDTAPQNVHEARSASGSSARFGIRADSPSPRRPPRAPSPSPTYVNPPNPFPRGLLPTPDHPPNPFPPRASNPPRPESPIFFRPRTPHRSRPRSPILTRPRTPYPHRSQSPIPVRPRTPHRTCSRTPVPARPHTPYLKRTCADEPPAWETPPPGFRIQSYFESLKNREQQMNLFGSSQVPQGSLRVDRPSVNTTRQSPPRKLNLLISGSDDAVTFTDFCTGNTGASGCRHSDSGPGNAPSSDFQGTWRRRGPERNKATRKFKSGQKPGTLLNGSTFETRHEQASHPAAVKREKIDDARVILERKRKAALEEDIEENTESSQQQQQPANEMPLENAQQSTKRMTFSPSEMPRQKVMKESVQHNTRLWVESHFSEAMVDPAVTHTADIHEVDEGRLLPQNIQLEAISYVVFLDIDKRSCFEEIKQPFLSGTLLYLFYGDASVLLPTKDHPFYKNNQGCWVHFYPDCGTEYGSYMVAAPAVINWMDQKLPQTVKFLVHGHQKLLHLEPLSRKVIYYPTSRTLDVQLLNRMLKGVFDSAKPPNNTAPTTMKTIVIRSAARPAGGTPMPAPTARNTPCSPTPARSSASPRLKFPSNSPTASKHNPILAPGQSQPKVPEKPPVKPPRQKVLWDL